MIEKFGVNKNDFDAPVIVTGAGGCIGGWVLHRLQRAGIPVIAIDLTKDQRRPKLLMTDEELAEVQWVTGGH